jgi:hypothetical protein
MAEVDEVVHAFRNRIARENTGQKTVNLSTDGERIYSHCMAIAGRGLDGAIEVLYARCAPSKTTTKHIRWIGSLLVALPPTGRRVDALGCPKCSTCAGYHGQDETICKLNVRIRNGKFWYVDARSRGLTPTMWRNPTELRAAGLEVEMAPRLEPWAGMPQQYLGVDHCWVEPNVARMLEVCGAADGITRRQVICALRLAASSEDYRIALKVAAEADGMALAGFIRSSTAGVNLSDRHPSARQFTLEVVDA